MKENETKALIEVKEKFLKEIPIKRDGKDETSSEL